MRNLIYLSYTKFDIVFTVSVFNQHLHSPTKMHLDDVYQILSFLKWFPGKGLLYQKGKGREIEIFTDADWTGSIEYRRSTIGYSIIV